MSDASLSSFKDWKNLATVDLGVTPISDVGVVRLKDCKNLTQLRLVTKVTAARFEGRRR